MTVDWEKIFAAMKADCRGYQSIVNALIRAVEEGELRSGDRLPTQRFVAQRLGMAIGTITRAYAELEHLGLVVGKVGSGTYVSNFAEQRSLPRQGADRASAVVDMTVSRPPPQGAAVHLANALRLLSKRHDLVDLLGTEPPNGWIQHRMAAAKWMSRRLEGVEPDQIVMCNGVQHALSTIFAAFTRAGDVVATENLNYPGIKLLADLHRIRLVGVAMDSEGLRTEKLEQACNRTAVRFVLCSPTVHNPTTITMSVERRLALAALARKHNFLIIENDILGMMPAAPLPALRSLAPHHTIYVTGLSKAVAAGLRVGFIVASSAQIPPLMSGIRSTTWMPQPLMLEIFSTWIASNAIEEMIAWHRNEIAARLALARRFLSGQDLRGDPSAYHVWLTLPGDWTSDQFVECAYNEGVWLSPSDTFIIDTDVSPNAARISLGAPNSRERLAQGLEVLALIFERGAGRLRS